MMSNKGNAEVLVRCPFDESHQIGKGRLALHLVKCRRNHLDAKVMDCPYDKCHVVPEVESKYHEENCCQRVVMDKFLCVSDGVDMNKYETPNLHVKAKENWDNDTVPTYDPQKNCESKIVMRNLMQTHSAAERRKFRMNERARIQSLANQQNVPVVNEKAETDTDEEKEEKVPDDLRRPVVESVSTQHNNMDPTTSSAKKQNKIKSAPRSGNGKGRDNTESDSDISSLLAKVKLGSKILTVPPPPKSDASGYTIPLNNSKEYPALGKPKFPKMLHPRENGKGKGRGRGSLLNLHN